MRGAGRGSRYYSQEAMAGAIFPDATLRHVGHMVREIKPIPGYRAVVNITNDETFAIVKEGYKVVQHQEIIDMMDQTVSKFPEYGEPSKEMWMTHNGGRIRVRYTFKDVDHKVGTGDIIHPTFESYGSMDTTLIQRCVVGALRLVCTNGMTIGKKFAEYRRKHTESLDINSAAEVLASGMRNFSEVEGLLVKMQERQALKKEVFSYEELGFSADEKLSIESELRKQGKVTEWDYEDKEKRNVEIGLYNVYNILTAEVSHHVADMNRRVRIEDNIAKTFFPQFN